MVAVGGDVAGTDTGIQTLFHGAVITVGGNVYGVRRGIAFGGGYSAVTVHGAIIVPEEGYYISITAIINYLPIVLADYAYRYNGFYVFEIGAGILHLRQEAVQTAEILPTGVFLFLHSYEIFNAVDNSVIQIMDVLPVLQNDRTLVPVRFIAYVLGAEVGWCPYSYEVTLTLDNRSLTFTIGELAPGMDVLAQLIGERTFVPLRFIIEFFGAEVDWCPDEQRIDITLAP